MTREEQDALREQYKPGTRVVFRDGNATVSDGVDGLRTGMVNGDIWFADEFEDDAFEELEGAPMYLHVFAARDKGREPTTIIVAWANVVGVEA